MVNVIDLCFICRTHHKSAGVSLASGKCVLFKFHLLYPPNCARICYTTGGALFISVQQSTDAVDTL